MTTTAEATQDEAYQFLKRCAERGSGVATEKGSVQIYPEAALAALERSAD